VFVEYQRLQEELEQGPTEYLPGRSSRGSGERTREPGVSQARAALAEFVGARAEDLVFVPNATSGLNAVIRSLS
jgi:isopenicillin-N epimerase